MKKITNNRKIIVIITFSLIALLIISLYSFYTPIWETNDDVGMSMVIHGYGISNHKSPNLIFSNILWGKILLLIPNINNILGYSIATIFIIFISSSFIYYNLIRLNVGWLVSSLLVLLIIIKPILIPQFTLNAGLLTIAAILSLINYKEFNKNIDLITAFILAYLAFLIRNQEFLITLIIGLPFINFKRLLNNHNFKIAIIYFIIGILIAQIYDWNSYRNSEWINFFEYKNALSQYIDYGLAEKIKSTPELMIKFDYSINDLDLISNWFWVDQEIIQPNKLNDMANEYGKIPFFTTNIMNSFYSLKIIYSNNILPFSVLIILSILLNPSFKLLFSVSLLLMTIFFLGLIGRGALDRVVLPLFYLVTIFSFIKIDCEENFKNKLYLNKYFQILIFLALIIFSINNINKYLKIQKQKMDIVQNEAKNYQNTLIFSWGEAMNFEYLYPVLAKHDLIRKIKIYSLGGFVHAPFSIAYNEEVNNTGFIEKFKSQEGMLIVASDTRLKLLDIWCKERFDKTFTSEIIYFGNFTKINKVKCN